MPTSLSREETQASLEEIISCESSYPPLDFLHNEILVVNSLDHEKCFQGNESNCLAFEALVHPFQFESENYVDATSFPVDETKLEPVKHMSRSILRFCLLVHND